MKYKQDLVSRIVYVCLLLVVIIGGLLACLCLALPVALSESAPSETAAQKFNGKIAFYSDQNSLAFDIFLINPDGSSRTRITDDFSNPNLFGGTFDFSPS